MKNRYHIPVFILLFSVLSVDRARADLVFNITESAGSVIVFGSGSIDLTGLTKLDVSGSGSTGIDPSRFLHSGGVFGSSVPLDLYRGTVIGPSSFGPGTTQFAPTSVSGDYVGFNLQPVGANAGLVVPDGYLSGDSLNGFSSFSSTSLGALGIATGTYDWTVGSNNISLTVTSVPEPSSALLVGFSALFVTFFRRRKSIA